MYVFLITGQLSQLLIDTLKQNPSLISSLQNNPELLKSLLLQTQRSQQPIQVQQPRPTLPPRRVVPAVKPQIVQDQCSTLRKQN